MTSDGRGHHVCLVASFLLVIFAVPLAQAIIELAHGEVPQCLDIVRNVPTAQNLRIYESGLESQSWFAQTLRPWMQYARFVALRDAGEKALVGRGGWCFYRPGVQYLIEPARSDAEHGTGPGQAAASILSFRDRLAARGIRLLVVPLPGKAGVYPDMLTRRVEGCDPLVHEHTRRLMDDLQEAAIHVVDTWQPYAEHRALPPARNPVRLYLERDTHWTPRGVRLAAEHVARRIMELRLINRGPVTYTTRPIVVRRAGDLPRMLQSPPISNLYGPEEVTCEQVVRADTGEPYRDDPNAPILVLGDSFLRIYERDDPGSAGFIAHLAKALGRPVASIVNDGGASTLVRQELARKPELLAGKKLVVWEFVERDIRFGMEGWQDVPLPDAR